MQFQITTDYAIRIIGYLSERTHQLLTARYMAKELGITYNYFIKIVTKLRKHGLIESVQGPTGGYRLLKNASEITLYDVVVIMEGEIRVNRCLEDDKFCSRHGTAGYHCPVHKVLEQLQTTMVTMLQSQKISDLWPQSLQPLAHVTEEVHELTGADI